MMILREQIKIAKSHLKETTTIRINEQLLADIKNRMEEAITEPNIEGDPTRSDE